MVSIPLNKIVLHNACNPWPLPDQSIHCIVTSPPYWGLRDYGMEGQLGMETTPEEYVSKLISVLNEGFRVLRNDGTLWLNLGDSYARRPQNETDPIKNGGYHRERGSAITASAARNGRSIPVGLKEKDLVGIPWMVAFALRSAGWYLRQDIIWSKPNPMPESVTDRCTKSHEYLFMLSKSAKYFYDHNAIKTAPAPSSIQRTSQNIADQQGSDRVPGKSNGTMKAVGALAKVDKQRGHSRRHNGFNDRWDLMTVAEQQALGSNKRSVWNVPTIGFSEAHFATFPPELIIDCIKAGCPVGGIVLDPFMGAGTTALVARKLDRNFVGLELNPDYITMAETRLQKELGLFH